MNTRSILLAEDDPCDAALTLAALEEAHLQDKVFVVRDGEQVLDYLYRRGEFAQRDGSNPLAVLLDLKMPKLGGLEALKIIKQDDHLKTVPIIMLTSSRETTDLTACYEQGANAYVVKPVSPDEFATAVKQLGIFWGAVNEPPPEVNKKETTVGEAGSTARPGRESNEAHA